MWKNNLKIDPQILKLPKSDKTEIMLKWVSKSVETKKFLEKMLTFLFCF